MTGNLKGDDRESRNRNMGSMKEIAGSQESRGQGLQKAPNRESKKEWTGC